MSDEIQQVESAGQEFIGVYADIFKFTHSFMAEMREFKDSLPQKKAKIGTKDDTLSEILDSGLTSFKFTGQDTDLCYFSKSERMPITAIANIENQQIKTAVIENFDRFIKDDYLEIKDDSLYITAKGKKYIQDDFFIRQAKADQMQMHNNILFKSAERENVKVIAFTGNYVNDFTYFSYADKLDLNDVISHPNKELSGQILDNVELWQKKGAVTVENGIATVTPDGKAMLGMSEFKKSSVSLNPRTLSEVNTRSSQFFVKLQSAVQTQAQQNVLKNTVAKTIKR